MKKLSKIRRFNEPAKNTVSCNFYDLNDFNIFLLCSHINELKLLLSSLNLNFEIICISESKITMSYLTTSYIHIAGDNIEQTPTGDSLIHISQKLSYKKLG